MSTFGYGSHVRQYQEVGVHSGAAYADPHRLVQMLLEGVLERIAQARGAMEHGATAQKGERIGKAIDIVANLRASLDLEQGGEIAGNLSTLYDYIEGRLFDANLKNDAAALNEAAKLLREIKEGWDAIRASQVESTVAGGSAG